jgi:hypothetical protein
MRKLVWGSLSSASPHTSKLDAVPRKGFVFSAQTAETPHNQRNSRYFLGAG